MIAHYCNNVKGYVGSVSQYDEILKALIDLGGHNNLHLIPNNPQKIYYLLPNKTISCKWISSTETPVSVSLNKCPFNLYMLNGIALCMYSYDDNTAWNPFLGFVHIPNDNNIKIIEAQDSDIKTLCAYAKKEGYVYIKSIDAWKFRLTHKSPCYFKLSNMDMTWKIGVFLDYDENGNAVIDQGSDSTLICRAAQCVPYKRFNELVDSTGQINDKLVNVRLI